MIEAFEVAKGLDLTFKPGDEPIVIGDQANEGVEGLSGCRSRPIRDEIELGLGWAVAVGAEVVPDPLDALFEEVAFLGVEREAILPKHFAHTSKVGNGGLGQGDQSRVSSMMFLLPTSGTSSGRRRDSRSFHSSWRMRIIKV
jgi:hypothetical protein